MKIQTITIDTEQWAVVPRVPTVSNEMKRRFIGEYCWQEEAPYYDENGVLHDNMATREIPWDMCKKIYKEMAAHWIATAPQPEQAQQSDSIHLPPLPDLPQKIGSYSCDYWEDEQVYEYAQDYAREAVRMNAQVLRPVPTSELPSFLYEIAEKLRTQDNRITAEPIFAVQKLVKDIVPRGYEDGSEWVEIESGDYRVATEKTAARLETLHKCGRDTGKWKKLHYRERWEFVTACFTEAAANEHIKLNGHNIGRTRTYAYSAFRNPEMIALRKWLIGLTRPAEVCGE